MQRENCPIADSSATKPTWTDLGSNTGLRDDRPTNSRLRRGTAGTRILFTSKVYADFMRRQKPAFVLSLGLLCDLFSFYISLEFRHFQTTSVVRMLAFVPGYCISEASESQDEV
jgi:hypothetical protein